LRMSVGTVVVETFMSDPTTRFGNLFRDHPPEAGERWGHPVRWGPCVS
jgi:hypothetical protein